MVDSHIIIKFGKIFNLLILSMSLQFVTIKDINSIVLFFNGFVNADLIR